MSVAFSFKAEDPIGSNIPSPISNPSRPGGEPIPAPGKLPPEYPHYLKPIPINTRDVEKVLRGYLDREEPEVVRFLYSTWTAQADAIKYQELRNAIREGEISEHWLADWRQQYSKMVNEELAPKWQAAMNESAEYIGESIGSAFGEIPAFNENARRIRQWIETRGGDLIVDISKSQHKAVRNILGYYTTENPIGADELGRMLRATVGLTPGQADAVRNFRETLVAEGELSRKKIEHKVQNYSARLQRIRADRIARTELSFAFNNGQLEQMRQARENVLEGADIVKQLWAAGDERMCNHCGPLHRAIIGIDQTFPGSTSRVPNTFMPPLHPGCRCTVIWNVVE